MKQTSTRYTAIISLALLAALASGCASVAVSNDAIETNTATALGLQKGMFKISDRVDDGVKSSYTVKTDAGRQYACYVTGTLTAMGRVVSDAMCNEIGKPVKQVSGGAAPTPACNALLKTAGKC